MNRFKLLSVGLFGLMLLGAGCSSTPGTEIFDIVGADPSVETNAGGYYDDVQRVRGVNTLVRPSDITSNGQGVDGFPILTEPKFVSVDEAEAEDVFFDDIRGYAVDTADGSRFYSTQVLAWHGLVLDEIDGQSVVASHSVLSGTGGVYEHDSDEDYGLSGYVWNSDALFYDESTESLWSVLLGRAVYGERAGESLSSAGSYTVTWGEWKQAHPDGEVLSSDTGFVRRYDLSPYGKYITMRDVIFETTNQVVPALETKAIVQGIVIDGAGKAYQEGPLVEIAGGLLLDTFAGRSLVVWTDEQRAIRVHDVTDGPEFERIAGSALIDSNGDTWELTASGDLTNDERVVVSIPTTEAFWFAWSATYPETELYAVVRGRGLQNGPIVLEEGDGVETEEGGVSIEVDDSFGGLEPVFEAE